MANLQITIGVSDEDLVRMVAAFARRTGQPNLTADDMLLWLKKNAKQQINAVVVAEEQSAIEEQKALVLPLTLS